MQARDPALPRGGGPGEGQKKTPSRWPGVWESAFEPVVRLEGYFRCLGVCPRFCSEELSRFRGIGFSASICSRRVLISVAAALSMAARSSQSFTSPAPPSRRRHDRKPASPTLGRAGGSDYPSFSAEDRLLLVENPSSNLNEGPLLLGRPARAASVSRFVPSSQK